MRALPINDDGVKFSGKGKIAGCLLTPDGTNTATLSIYDSASATTGETGRVIYQRAITESNYIHFEGCLLVTEGAYALITGTGAKGVLYVK
jgi:hypothetical protein